MASPFEGLHVQWWPPGRLRPSGRNPRRHPPEQLAALEASVEAFGFVNPILARPDGEIVAGEARREVAGRKGLATVPVIVLAHLGEPECDALRIADNRLPLGASWDEALLARVVADLARQDVPLPALGFDAAELTRMLDAALDDGEPPEAPPAETPGPPVSRVGDAWLLGDHRLVCGDATDAATVSRAVGGAGPQAAVADLVFTDPPYGMAYEGGRARRLAVDLVFTDPPYGMAFGAGKAAGSTAKGATVKAHGEILGDARHGDALVALVRDALRQAVAVCRPEAAFYVCLTWRTYVEFWAALAEAGLEVAACIVWDKGSIGLGHQHYRPQHEFIFYCRGARWNGGKDQGDVWTVSRGSTGEYVHPTQKPVALVERALRNSSRPGDRVLDLFGGSGSTVIACERLGRRASAVELDPKYADAILRRWEAVSGGTATLEGDGRSFTAIAAERRAEGEPDAET